MKENIAPTLTKNAPNLSPSFKLGTYTRRLRGSPQTPGTAPAASWSRPPGSASASRPATAASSNSSNSSRGVRTSTVSLFIFSLYITVPWIEFTTIVLLQSTSTLANYHWINTIMIPLSESDICPSSVQETNWTVQLSTHQYWIVHLLVWMLGVKAGSALIWNSAKIFYYYCTATESNLNPSLPLLSRQARRNFTSFLPFFLLSV